MTREDVWGSLVRYEAYDAAVTRVDVVNAIRAALDGWAAAERERDEARAEAERWREIADQVATGAAHELNLCADAIRALKGGAR